jgi:hypothetical protein
MSMQTSDLTQLAFAIVAAIGGIISCLIVLRNENRRHLRQRLRLILEAQQTESVDEGERKFATQIGEAIKSGKFSSLERVSLVPFLNDYLIDFEFKPKLSRFLVEYVSENKLNPSESDLKQALAAIDLWKDLDSKFEQQILAILNASPANAELKDVKRFVASRPEYFDTKAKEFVEDVKEAVQFAVAK